MLVRYRARKTKKNTNMAKKQSTKKSGIKDDAEFFAKVNEFALADVEWRKLTAQQDRELQEVRDRYDTQLATLKKRKEALLKETAVFAALNQDQVLKKGLRSGTTTLARYGFQLGNPTVSALSKKYSMKDILIQAKLKPEEWRMKYLVYPEPTLNKDALRKGLSESDLTKMGLKVTQTDSFYIAPLDQSDKV